jgi:hypothetical protein
VQGFVTWQLPVILMRLFLLHNKSKLSQYIIILKNGSVEEKGDLNMGVRSEDAHLVSDPQSVALGGEPNVGLLLAVRPYERVNRSYCSGVNLLEGFLNLLLVGVWVHEEHQGILVFHLLHAFLASEG